LADRVLHVLEVAVSKGFLSRLRVAAIAWCFTQLALITETAFGQATVGPDNRVTDVAGAASEENLTGKSVSAAKAKEDVAKDTIPYSGPEDTVYAECRNRYYPSVEVRALSDLPLTLMFTKVKGSSKYVAAPAAGVDALSLWWAPYRPFCQGARVTDPDHDKVQTVYTAKKENFFYLIGALNVSYMTLAKDETLSVGDPASPTEVDVSTALSGAYLSGSVGVFFTAKWPGGGHGNQVGIGGLARFGAFFSNDSENSSQALFAFGPALKVSLY
jgi:hypothetical protein